MSRHFFSFLLFLGWSPWTLANFDNCPQHFFEEKPILRIQEATQYELCNLAYAVLYDGAKRIPLAAFAKITPEALTQARQLSRKGIEFREDKRLNPSHRSFASDYLGSGYDRGHLIGNAFFGEKAAQKESFWMSNITPQTPALNREVFAKIELDTRKYVRRTRHTIYMAVGVGHAVSNCQILVSQRICVIDILWIAIMDPVAKKSWGHWLHNAGGAQLTAPLSVKEIENRLGTVLFVRPT